MSHNAAIGELKDNAGTQFDPHVVDALVDLAAERPDLVACWAGLAGAPAENPAR
jgi:HD-GYP domain-containing protein (c-di-GMP phosphodiesterase class II)